MNYGVKFTMMSESSVRGSDANTLFKALAESTNKEPSWNFNKYLIQRDGRSVKHYTSSVKPLNGELEREIIEALKK